MYVVYFDQRLGAAHAKLVDIVIFSIFAAKNLKKQEIWRNLQQISVKNSFFLICTKTLVDLF